MTPILIEPGTVHAIKGGTLLLETQQNSAITYRLYDYDRLAEGKLRELHIDKSIDVICCPHKENKSAAVPEAMDGYRQTRLVSCEYYTVDKYDITKSLTLEEDLPFLIVSVIEGEGLVDGHPIKKGDNFILPSGYGACCFTGIISLITSHI